MEYLEELLEQLGTSKEHVEIIFTYLTEEDQNTLKENLKSFNETIQEFKNKINELLG